ncbi:MAG: carbohydrate kinase family protein [Gaiellaceae bacterium]
MPPVAVIGNLSRDVLPGLAPRAGGGPYHAARALALLSQPSRLVVKCAERHRRALLAPLLSFELPVSWRASADSAGFEIAEKGDSRTMAIISRGDRWTTSEARGWIAEALDGCEWVHVAALMRGEFSAETLAELARGRSLMLDAQGLARRPELGPLVLDGDFDRELLRSVQVLKLAEVEAEAILGEISSFAIAELGVDEVVVTRGSRGSLVYAAGERIEVPALPVVRNVDTTGAGDAFAAIYLVCRSRGRSPERSARRAAAFVGAMLGKRLPLG